MRSSSSSSRPSTAGLGDAYKFDANTSTFIVECQPDTFAAWGFGELSQEETCRTCEALFAEHLGAIR